MMSIRANTIPSDSTTFYCLSVHNDEISMVLKYPLTNLLSRDIILSIGGDHMEEIARMQEHLLLIRRTVGWTAEEFGERIGVTRQTINNIESGRNRLTKTQYIAMRSVLDAEMAQSPEDTKMLRILLEILVDNPSKYSKADREKLISKANMVAPSILSGAATRKEVSKEWVATATAIGGGIMAALSVLTVAGPIIGSTWLSIIMHANKKKKG